MKLKDVKHKEMFCGEPRTDEFSIYSNRFVLFDKNGKQLNEWAIAKLPNYLDLEVLEVKESGYQSSQYFVGFPTTHIKLNIESNDLLGFQTLGFGEIEND